MAIAHGPGAVEHGVSTAGAGRGDGRRARALRLCTSSCPRRSRSTTPSTPAGSWATRAGVGGPAAAPRRRRPLRGRRGGAAGRSGVFGAGLWLLGLLPGQQRLAAHAILMADRYLYLPAVGLYLLLLGLLAPLARGTQRRARRGHPRPRRARHPADGRLRRLRDGLGGRDRRRRRTARWRGSRRGTRRRAGAGRTPRCARSAHRPRAATRDPRQGAAAPRRGPARALGQRRRRVAA